MLPEGGGPDQQLSPSPNNQWGGGGVVWGWTQQIQYWLPVLAWVWAPLGST